MSIYNIAKLSNKDLKKLASEYISLDDVYDECEECGRPQIKEEREKEKKQNVYLDGIKQIVHTLQMQINTPDTKKDTSTP